GRAENGLADGAGGRAVDRQDKDDEQQISQLEQRPGGAEQALEEALVIIGAQPPREDERQRAENAEQQGREEDRVDAAPRAAREEEFGELPAGGKGPPV